MMGSGVEGRRTNGHQSTAETVASVPSYNCQAMVKDNLLF